jgi:hypothetical protein
MKRIGIAAVLALVAGCGGASGSSVAVSVAGVTAADLEPIKAELSKLPGVSAVTMGSMKDGQAVFTLTSTSKGGDLAGALAKSASGLKNVKGFDDVSIQVSFDGKAEPVAVKPEPAKAETPKGETPKGETPKEETLKIEKDPLAYKMHKFNGGTIATFEGWKIQGGQDGNWITLGAWPEGKENDFQLITTIGTPTQQEMEQFFELGPQFIRQKFPGFKANNDGKETKFGGDPGYVETYEAEYQGKRLTVKVIYVKRKDIAVAVMGLGTDDAFKTYGRAVEITAQSITFQESALEEALCGTWHMTKYYSSGTGKTFFSHSSATSMTIYPNGTFTKRSSSSTSGSGVDAYTDGGERGTVVKRGNNLTFRNDKGEVWNAEYKLEGGALMLNGVLWTRN